MTPSTLSHRTSLCLWRELTERLTHWRDDWRDCIDGPATPAGGDVFPAKSLSDSRIFEAFAVALLSGNTRWDRIARIRDDLHDPFAGFDPQRFSALSDHEIVDKILPWFRERKAGAPGLRGGLLRLRAAAARLSTYRQGEGGAHAFLLDALRDADGSPEDLAVVLGTSKTWKLPGFGIALAAEALRNLGVDLCKPDRHILRAVGSWSLVHFTRWDRRGAFTPPQAKPGELRETMFAVRSIAEANGLGVSYTNSVIWTAGAVSGARLTNDDFADIARRCRAPVDVERPAHPPMPPENLR